MEQKLLDIIQKLANRGDWESGKIAENFLMDFQGGDFVSSHSMAAERGNNIHPDDQAAFLDKLSAVDINQSIGNVLKDLEVKTFELEEKTPHYLTEKNQSNRCPANSDYHTATYTRYLSASQFYKSFVAPEEVAIDNEEWNEEKIKKKVDIYLNHLRLLPDDHFTDGWLGKPDYLVDYENQSFPFPMWIVPNDEAPHLREGFWDLFQTDDERAREVAKHLALPGFEDTDQRKRLIGIIAIEFEIVGKQRDLFKPTVLEAIRFAYFLPGPHNQVYGRTDILNNQLNQTTAQKGRKEFICESLKTVPKQNGRVCVKKIGYFNS